MGYELVLAQNKRIRLSQSIILSTSDMPVSDQEAQKAALMKTVFASSELDEMLVRLRLLLATHRIS